MFQDPSRDHEVSRSEGKVAMADMHAHSYYELYYLAAGSREYFVEDTIFPVQAGDFVLIAPGKLHRTGGEYGMRILVCFTEDFLLRTFTRAGAAKIVECFDKVKITPPEQDRGRFLDALNITERRVFLRRYWYLDSTEEIASAFGFSQSKVKSMLHRTRKKLRQQLEKEGF